MRELNKNDVCSVDGGGPIFWDFDEPVFPLECVVPCYTKPLDHYGFPVEPIDPR